MTPSGAGRRGRCVLLMLGLGLALGVAPASVGAAGPKVPRFVEETATSGIDHVNSYAITPQSPDGGWEFVVGGGMAVFDCDQDGLPDLYLAGGSSPSQLVRNASEVGGTLRFERLPDPTTDLVKVAGAYPLDVDSDGLVDLAVIRLGENVMLRGLGGCRFERANERWGIDGGIDWTNAFSATWEGGAALPTLAFGNYLAVDAQGDQTDGCASSLLLRPDAAGERYGTPFPLTPGLCTLSILFSDWDRSGHADLRMSNDRQYYVNAGEEQLWQVVPGQAPRLYGPDDAWQRLQLWGMGIASHDLTGDGRPEVFLTTMGDNRLLTLADGTGRPEYKDIAEKRGVQTRRPVAGNDKRPSTAWHPEFEDVNNDGFVDLFVSKGNVDEMRDNARVDSSSLLLGTPKGPFVESAKTAGTLSEGRGRGAAVVDLNLDGLPDLVQVNLGEPTQVWRNAGAGTATAPAAIGHWLAVDLEQPGPNRDAIGAWLEVRTGERVQTWERTVGGGHASGQLGPIHVGLGSAETAEVRVQWPDGAWGPWLPVTADQAVVVERGATAVREVDRPG